MAKEEPNIQQKQAEIIARQLSNPRINDRDKELIRNTFASRHDLILAIRNVFFNQASKDEKKMVKDSFQSEETRRIVRKVILPEMMGNDPLKQSIDLWQTIDVEIEKMPFDENNIKRILRARKSLIEMLNQSLELLHEPDGQTVDLNLDNKEVDSITYEYIKARNTFISHVEQMLIILITISATTPETPEEALMRMKKNSTK